MHQTPSAKSILKSAITLDAQGQERAAIPLYRQAIAGGLSPSDLWAAMIGLGSSLQAAGQSGAAIRTLQAARKRYPRDVAVMLFLALAHARAGQEPLAIRQLADGLLKESRQPGLAMFRKVLARKYHAYR